MYSDLTPPPVLRALELLGKNKLFLAIHDGSFPADGDEELGRGTPYSRGGRRLAAFARRLGFNGLQLGAQGQTSRGNPSPYDGTAFSRNSLSISVGEMARDPELAGLVSEEQLQEELGRIPRDAGARVRYEPFCDSQMRLLKQAFLRLEDARSSQAGGRRSLFGDLARFTRGNRVWLEPDSLYEALIEEHGSEDWRLWPEDEETGIDRRLFCPAPGQELRAEERKKELRRSGAGPVSFYAFCQFLAHRQHRELQAEARSLGLELFADLQIGLSIRDAWALQSLFLPGYALGAPPSRTNPEGQPWGYPVFDPAGYRLGGERPGSATGLRGGGSQGEADTPGDGPVLRLMRRRIEKLFREYDGLRIDHPQGLVCPWVYRRDDPDPLHAVQHGARLFAAPDFVDHPRLAAYAIPRRSQLSADPEVPRYHDAWVTSLEPEQVERYGTLLTVLVGTARARGRGSRDVACEILSTLPYPLDRLIRLHGLGRFRVTQKADPRNPDDVYRSDNAESSDWVMLGTHDTPPIWALVERWFRDGQARDRAAYLARRLAPRGAVSAWRREFLRDPGRLVHAEFADLLASRAEQVSVFFADLFGLKEVYNTPGSVGPENWSLRVPADYERSYPRQAARLRALNLPYALALALGSPLRGLAENHASLIDTLRGTAAAVEG